MRYLNNKEARTVGTVHTHTHTQIILKIKEE